MGTFIGRSRFSHNGTLVKNSRPPEIFMPVKIFYHVASFCHKILLFQKTIQILNRKVLDLCCSHLNTALVQRNVENLAGLSKQYCGGFKSFRKFASHENMLHGSSINTSDKYAETFTRLQSKPTHVNYGRAFPPSAWVFGPKSHVDRTQLV